MRINGRGQVIIPQEIRERLGLRPGSEVEFVVEGDTVCLRKAGKGGTRGRNLVAGLRARATSSLSTDEILALTRS